MAVQQIIEQEELTKSPAPTLYDLLGQEKCLQMNLDHLINCYINQVDSIELGRIPTEEDINEITDYQFSNLELLKDKIDSYRYAIDNNLALSKSTKEIATTVTNRAKAYSTHAENIKNRLKSALFQFPTRSISGNTFTPYLSSGDIKVTVTDPEQVPSEYVDYNLVLTKEDAMLIEMSSLELDTEGQMSGENLFNLLVAKKNCEKVINTSKAKETIKAKFADFQVGLKEQKLTVADLSTEQIQAAIDECTLPGIQAEMIWSIRWKVEPKIDPEAPKKTKKSSKTQNVPEAKKEEPKTALQEKIQLRCQYCGHAWLELAVKTHKCPQCFSIVDPEQPQENQQESSELFREENEKTTENHGKNTEKVETVEKFSHCIVCGFQIYNANGFTDENRYCPECKIKRASDKRVGIEDIQVVETPPETIDLTDHPEGEKIMEKFQKSGVGVPAEKIAIPKTQAQSVFFQTEPEAWAELKKQDQKFQDGHEVRFRKGQGWAIFKKQKPKTTKYDDITSQTCQSEGPVKINKSYEEPILPFGESEPKSKIYDTYEHSLEDYEKEDEHFRQQNTILRSKAGFANFRTVPPNTLEDFSKPRECWPEPRSKIFDTPEEAQERLDSLGEEYASRHIVKEVQSGFAFFSNAENQLINEKEIPF